MIVNRLAALFAGHPIHFRAAIQTLVEDDNDEDNDEDDDSGAREILAEKKGRKNRKIVEKEEER